MSQVPRPEPGATGAPSEGSSVAGSPAAGGLASAAKPAEAKKPRRWRPRFSLRTLTLCVLLTASAGSLWMRWNPWILEKTLSANGRYTDRVLFLPGNLFATHAPGCIRIWRADTLDLLHDIKMEDDRASSLWKPPGANVLMTLATGGAIEEWDPRTGQHIRRVAESCASSDSSITGPTWSRDGRRLFEYLPDFMPNGVTTVRVIDYKSGEVLFLKTFPRQGAGRVMTIDLSPDGKCLAYLLDLATAAGPEKDNVSLVLWDLDAKRPIREKDILQTDQTLLEFSKDGKTLCLYSYPPDPKRYSFYGIPEGRGEPFDPKPYEPDLKYSPDGKYLIDRGINELRVPGATHFNPSRSPQIRNAETGARAVYLARTTQEVYDDAFAPDGRLAVAKADGTVDIWRYSRPEPWWGIAWLPEFWLTALFALLLVWSLARDVRTLRMAAT